MSRFQNLLENFGIFKIWNPCRNQHVRFTWYFGLQFSDILVHSILFNFLILWYPSRILIFSYISVRDHIKWPKKLVKEAFLTWWHFHFYLKCPEIEEWNFRYFFCFYPKCPILKQKIKFSDFGAFQMKMQMPSCEKQTSLKSCLGHSVSTS